MDLVTHALAGAWAGSLAAPPDSRLPPREPLLIGAGAALFPDADFVGFAIDPLRYLADWHQGPTHSLLLLPLWAALLATAYCALTRRRPAWVAVAAVCAAGLATHAALDLLTAYGTQLLHPLSQRRFSLGASFVVDPLLSATIAAGVAASALGRRRLALAAVAALGLVITLQLELQSRALQLAHRVVAGADRIDALAQPFSPFNWRLIVSEGSGYRVAHVNLLGHPPLVPSWPGLRALRQAAESYVAPAAMQWQPRHRFGPSPEQAALAQGLWQRPEFAAFRRFATHPARSPAGADGASACVWFTDLRYDLPQWPDTFRYGWCRDAPDAPWQLFRLRYFSADARQRVGP